MARFRVLFIYIVIPMILIGCTGKGADVMLTASLEESIDEQTADLDPTMTWEGDELASPEAVTQEPEIEVESPTAEPPGDWEPAISRMQPGDNLVIRQITMVGAEDGWAIGGVNGRADSVLRSMNGGLTWREVSPPETIDPTNPLIAVGVFPDKDMAWVLYHPLEDPRPGGRQTLRLWYTNTAGEQWRASSPVSLEFVGSERANAWIQDVGEGQVWVLARYGGAGMHRYPVYLLKSEDFGATWEILEDPYEGRYLQSCPKTGWDWHPSGHGVITIGFCPFESAEIQLTSDGGTSWDAVRLPFPTGEEERLGFTSCEAHSPILVSQVEMLVASDCPIWEGDPETIHLLYRTQDFGVTWEIWEYPGGQLLPLSGEVILALGRDLYRSEDQGLTWTLVKTLAWDGRFSFIDPLQGWSVATNENEIAFVRTTNGGETWQLIEPVLAP